MMTRKDYVAIAGVFNIVQGILDRYYKANAEELPGDEAWDYLRGGIADILQYDNPRFDRERFYAATKVVQ